MTARQPTAWEKEVHDINRTPLEITTMLAINDSIAPFKIGYIKGGGWSIDGPGIGWQVEFPTLEAALLRAEQLLRVYKAAKSDAAIAKAEGKA